MPVYDPNQGMFSRGQGLVDMFKGDEDFWSKLKKATSRGLDQFGTLPTPVAMAYNPAERAPSIVKQVLKYLSPSNQQLSQDSQDVLEAYLKGAKEVGRTTERETLPWTPEFVDKATKEPPIPGLTRAGETIWDKIGKYVSPVEENLYKTRYGNDAEKWITDIAKDRLGSISALKQLQRRGHDVSAAIEQLRNEGGGLIDLAVGYPKTRDRIIKMLLELEK